MIYPTLYKLSTTGKVSTWYIETEGNKFRTVSGFFDGLKVTSDWTVCEGKSYNNSEQQATKQAEALHKKKKDLGAFENINDIDKPTPFKPMLAKDWAKEKHKVTYKNNIFVQRKYDGVRCICNKDGLWTRNGKQIVSSPHIFNGLNHLFKQDPNLILDGELFAEKEICDFNKIISCVKKTKPKIGDLIESEKYIKYYVYDFPSCEEKYYNRNIALKNLNLPDCCVLVETYSVNNEKQIKEFYTQFIEEGYEGLIVRLNSLYQNSRSSYLLKYKEFFDQEFIIKDIIQGIGKLTNKAGTILCEIEGKEFNSSINGTHEYLEEIWKNKNQFIGKSATVKYFELTSDGIPRFPKVIQIDRNWE
jgi:DNA ligase-1